MKFTRNRYQEGSLRKVRRKSGAEVWEYRYRSHAEPGSPMRQKTFSVRDYPTESKMRLRLQEEKLRINDPESFRAHNEPTFGLVLDQFEREERLEQIVKQPTGESTITDGFSWSTAAGYRSYIKTHVRPKWEGTSISDMKPLDILKWLKSLPLSPKTRGHVRALMHLLFEKAMLWGLMDLVRNPVEVVKLRGTIYCVPLGRKSHQENLSRTSFASRSDKSEKEMAPPNAPSYLVSIGSAILTTNDP